MTELEQEFSQVPLTPGYELVMAPLALPLSLKEFKSLMFENKDNILIEGLIEESGHKVTSVSEWYNSTEGLKQRDMVIETNTGVSVIGTTESKAIFTAYKNSDSELQILSFSHADTTVVDAVNIWQNWEVIEPIPDVVVIRHSYRVEWLYKLWFGGTQLENYISNQSKESGEIARKYYPRKIREWRDKQIQEAISQAMEEYNNGRKLIL